MKILDGYNVIGAAKGLGLSLSHEDKEERFLRLLVSYRSLRRKRESLLVVFDGSYGQLARGPKKSTRGGITVEYAVGESADEVIVRRLRASSNPRQVEVVSSDGEVLRKVGELRGRGVRSEKFVAELKEAVRSRPELEKPSQVTPGEVEEWLDIFGEGEGGERR